MLLENSQYILFKRITDDAARKDIKQYLLQITLVGKTCYLVARPSEARVSN